MQVMGHFKKCKALKGIAAPQHSGACGGHEEGTLECPESLVRKFENVK